MRRRAVSGGDWETRELRAEREHGGAVRVVRTRMDALGEWVVDDHARAGANEMQQGERVRIRESDRRAGTRRVRRALGETGARGVPFKRDHGGSDSLPHDETRRYDR